MDDSTIGLTSSAASGGDKPDGGREVWLAAAKRELIQSGIASVRIGRLAKLRGTTRGGFYWHFKNLDDLRASLLANWEVTNTGAVLEALRSEGSANERFARLVEVWIEETEFDPAYDTAVREWALTSKAARAAVRRIDAERIAAVNDVMLLAGYSADEAMLRARVAYYHQVGYYAMRERETKAVRRRNAPLYVRILTGLSE